VIALASNDVLRFREKRDAYNDAKRNGVKGETLAKLKASMDAAKAVCPPGSTDAGIFG
jgi:hypothetical protein